MSDWRALLIGLGAGLVTGGLLAFFRLLLVWARVSWFRIETVETLNWRGLRAVLGGGLGLVGGGLLGGLLWLAGRGLDPPLSDGWVILPAIVGLISQTVAHALEPDEMKMRTTPGQGFDRSAQNGRLIGIITGVGTAVLLGLGWVITNWLNMSPAASTFWPFAVGISLYLGISAGLAYGGLAALQHKRLHRVLSENQLAPADYVHFLDYAAERNLLRKVGGGYMFVHLLLLDYFRETAKSDA